MFVKITFIWSYLSCSIYNMEKKAATDIYYIIII